MEKLTEAGKLYLNDFYILEEARNDLFIFLNYISDQIHDKWVEQSENKELFNKEEGLTWVSYKSKGTPGNMHFWPKGSGNQGCGLLEEGDSGISLAYGDVRHRAELYNPSSVQLHISVTNNFKKKLNQVPSNKLNRALEEAKKYNVDFDLDKRTIYGTQIKINVNDPQTAIDEITETLVEKCQGIEAFLKNCS